MNKLFLFHSGMKMVFLFPSFYSVFSNGSIPPLSISTPSLGLITVGNIFLSWPHLCVFSQFPCDHSIDRPTVVVFFVCGCCFYTACIYILKMNSRIFLHKTVIFWIIWSGSSFKFLLSCAQVQCTICFYSYCMFNHNSITTIEINLHYPSNNNCTVKDKLHRSSPEWRLASMR